MDVYAAETSLPGWAMELVQLLVVKPKKWVYNGLLATYYPANCTGHYIDPKCQIHPNTNSEEINNKPTGPGLFKKTFKNTIALYILIIPNHINIERFEQNDK